MSKLGKQLKSKIILCSPRITEKATLLADNSKAGVYVFEVAKDSTKTEIRQEFEAKYKVKPVKVNIVNLPAKKIVRRGLTGSKSAVKKAMVYLPAGQKVELV